MELTKNNFELYAASHYQKDKWATDEDFKEDISRFKYINRLVNRYYRDDDLKERLILNHIIVLYNVFGNAEDGFDDQSTVAPQVYMCIYRHIYIYSFANGFQNSYKHQYKRKYIHVQT